MFSGSHEATHVLSEIGESNCSKNLLASVRKREGNLIGRSPETNRLCVAPRIGIPGNSSGLPVPCLCVRVVSLPLSFPQHKYAPVGAHRGSESLTTSQVGNAAFRDWIWAAVAAG
jgi:hypothetical protein